MGFNSNTCMWLTRPTVGAAIVKQLLKVIEQENVALLGEKLHFHDLSSGEERSSEAVNARSIDQCLGSLLEWPAKGGIEISHPKISTGVVLQLYSLETTKLDYITLSMQYGSTSGENDERQLFLFSQKLFSRIKEFGLLYGESPEKTDFRFDEYSSFVDALSKVHELQLKKAQGEK